MLEILVGSSRAQIFLAFSCVVAKLAYWLLVRPAFRLEMFQNLLNDSSLRISPSVDKASSEKHYPWAVDRSFLCNVLFRWRNILYPRETKEVETLHLSFNTDDPGLGFGILWTLVADLPQGLMNWQLLQSIAWCIRRHLPHQLLKYGVLSGRILDEFGHCKYSI